jgi:hypothetical protein
VTASLRGLMIWTALLALLGMAWVLGLGGRAPVPAPQLWKLQPARVQTLRWQRDGRDELVVRRDGAGWQATTGTAPSAAPVRAGVVEDLLDIAAAARWHRQAPAAAAGLVTRRLLVDDVAIGLGERLGEQRWLLVGGRALLVDGWVARALELDPQQVLDRAALPDAARSPVLEIHGAAAPWHASELVLQGQGMVSPARRRLDPDLVRTLRERLSALRIEASTATPSVDPVDDSRWSVRIAGGPRGEATLSGGGACEGSATPRTRVASSRLGSGCVEDVALREVAELIDRAVSPRGADARPLAATADEVVEWSVASAASSGAPDSVRVTRDGGHWQAQRERAGVTTPFAVEPAAIDQVLAELATPWPVIGWEAGPRSALARLTARHRDGSSISLSISRSISRSAATSSSPSRRAVRDGETLALAVPPGLELTPALLATSLAARTLWRFEPTSIARVQLGALTLRRGAVLGEWLDAQGRPLPAASAARAAALDELLRSLGSLRARSRQPHGAALRRRISLWLDEDPARTAPSSAPASASHVLELAPAARNGECLGRADGIEARFEPDLCAQAAALFP